MNKLLILGILALLLIPNALALDTQTIIPCVSSDKEFIIDCLGDEQLFFMGLLEAIQKVEGELPLGIFVTAMVAAINQTPIAQNARKEKISPNEGSSRVEERTEA